jgi:cytochrome c oxidase subunit 3
MGDGSASMTRGIQAAQVAPYDPTAGRIGMWLFLFTEVLLFGTLFIAYAVYLHKYRFDFREASAHLNRLLGAANTMILLTSSLTMALSIAALERGRKRLCLWLLATTMVCALGFLAIKSFEWGEKFSHDIYPKSATVLQRPMGEQIFYGLYFTMTGLHALHVVIGGAAVLLATLLVQMERIRPCRIAFLHNTGLYWHLVDLIWIFLFPLFYLIR